MPQPDDPPDFADALRLTGTIQIHNVEFPIDIGALDGIAATLPPETRERYAQVRRELVEAFNVTGSSPDVGRRLEELHTIVRLVQAQGQEHSLHLKAKAKGEAQGKIARQPRSPVRALIARLCQSPEADGLSAKELWPQFAGLLDIEGFRPVPVPGPPNQPGKDRYQYVDPVKGRKGNITFGSFQAIVSGFRTGRLTTPPSD